MSKGFPLLLLSLAAMGFVLPPEAGDTIGKMAIAGVNLYTNEAIAGLLPKNPSEVLRDYLRFALSSVNPKEGSSHAVKGKTLNQDTLAALKIPIPLLAEQSRIVEIMDREVVVAKRLQNGLEERLETVTHLPTALLRQAFNGEL